MIAVLNSFDESDENDLDLDHVDDVDGGGDSNAKLLDLFRYD